MKVSRDAMAGVAVCVALGGCTVVGTGHDTVVLGSISAGQPAYPGTEFQGLLRWPGAPVVIPGHGTVETETQRWEAYKASHPGTADAARLDLTVRDLNIAPALDQLNIESSNAADIAKIMSDATTTSEQKIQLVSRLRDNYLRMPESYMPKVPREAFLTFPGEKSPEQVTIYHWFPKVGLDLTGQLQTVASRDRFDYIAVAITLDNVPDVTFANFAPKTADIFDFSLGSLKQSASATGSASIGGSAGTKATSSSTPSTGSTAGTEITGGATNGASASLTVSDEFTKELKSSLDTRSAGIVNGGRTFMFALRSNEQNRIAGTYTYSVMLDIAPKVSTTIDKGGARLINSDVPVPEIYANVRIVGVVRHVAKVGKTGTFKRIPESTNDDTFQEVIVSQKRVKLWELHADALTYAIPANPNLIVYSNQDAASFSVYADDKSHRLLARGKGREATLTVQGAPNVRIEFDPIILSGNTPTVLVAPVIAHVALAAGPVKLVGNYLPKPSKQKKEDGSAK